MFRGACAIHQRDLENGVVEEGLTHSIKPKLTIGNRKKQ